MRNTNFKNGILMAAPERVGEVVVQWKFHHYVMET